MSLLENAKKEAQVEGTVATAEATPKKKSNSEYQKRQRELAANGKQLKDFYGDKVPEQIKEAVAFFAREKKASAGGSAFGKPVIYKLFGDTPKKGASITAMKVFEDTGKGFAEMRQLIKKWAKSDIVVKFDEAKKAYVLDSDVPAYQA